jgi:DNA-binding transcriptional regulator PaaX
MDFIHKYPLLLKEIIATPMIFRENDPRLEGMPFPNMAIIRHLAEFAGFSYGALRTAVSRLKASGDLESFADEAGIVRFRLTSLQRSVSDVVRSWETRPKGFVIALFSFKSEEEKGRQRVREALKYFGFKRIAQNAYINGMIDTATLQATMREYGVADRLFLFRCSDVEDPVLVAKLKEVFDVRGRAEALRVFFADLRLFLGEKDLDGMEFGRRIFYAGPVYHMRCFVEEPPFPESFLPPDYPLPEVKSWYLTRSAERLEDVIAYYMGLCR